MSCKGSLKAEIDSATCTVNDPLITLTQAFEIAYGGHATTIKFGRIFFIF